MFLKRFASVALVTLAGIVSASPTLADGDAAKGEKVFRKCKACHQVGEAAKDKTGPELNAVIGRAAGSKHGFKYSDAMTEAGSGGLVWSSETLAEFLEKPKAYVSGTKMSFAGLRKEQERADVIAYLATFD